MLYYNKKSPVFAGLSLFFNTENGFSRLRHQQPLDIAPLIKIDTERITVTVVSVIARALLSLTVGAFVMNNIAPEIKPKGRFAAEKRSSENR